VTLRLDWTIVALHYPANISQTAIRINDKKTNDAGYFLTRFRYAATTGAPDLADRFNHDLE